MVGRSRAKDSAGTGRCLSEFRLWRRNGTRYDNLHACTKPSTLESCTMTTLINLVATRSRDGDHAAMFRWYSDHVHLLMGFAPLQRATLYRRDGTVPADDGPEYVCLYEFPSHGDFMAFEVSAARAQAQHVVQTGWARTGLEIVQRTQYLRLGQRRTCASGAGAVHHIGTLALGEGPLPGVGRWMADRVHGTCGGPTFASAAWHRAWDATDAGGDALLMAESGAPDAAAGSPFQHDEWQGGALDNQVGHRPATVAVSWQGRYRQLCTWAR